jgi:putative tryptophan/tyrosine transport system substrate-binding protein
MHFGIFRRRGDSCLSAAVVAYGCALAWIAGAGAWPAIAQQQTQKVYRVGILSTLQRPSESVFRKVMQDLGYVEGKNVVYDARYAGSTELLPDAATALVRAEPDIIVTAGGPASLAAKKATATIPIILWGAGDPVGTGLVVNVSHPEANVTGITELSTELTAKRLQLLRETVPSLKRVAVIWNPEDRAMTLRFREAEEVAPRLGLTLIAVPIRVVEDFDAAFVMMARDSPEGVLFVSDQVTARRRAALIQFMTAHHLPSIFEFPEEARAGGLMSYGASIAELAPRAAAMVDRILKGAKPSELPLEAPVRWRLVVNLKTATAIGLDVPRTVLAGADEVIE